MPNISINGHEGDYREVLEEVEDESIDAVVTDPPYGLAFMGNSWDDFTPSEYQEFAEEFASECLRVLKPGGHLVAFSGSRTHHRLFVGIEDAGYNIRDTLTWHYGSGFPKSQDIGKSIDRYGTKNTEDETRTVCEWLRSQVEQSDETFETVADSMGVTTSMVSSHWCAKPAHTQPQCPSKEQIAEILDFIGVGLSDVPESVRKVHDTVPDKAGEYADTWDEREVVGTKQGSISEAFGEDTWAIHEDGERGSSEIDITEPATDEAEAWDGWKTQLKPATEFAVLAQKPTSEDAFYKNCQKHGVGALNVDECRVSTDGGRYPSNLVLSSGVDEMVDEMGGGEEGASRYFSSVSAPQSFKYEPKAQKSERTMDGEVENPHPTVKPVDLMEWLVRLVTREGQTVLDPFGGSGTTALACIESGRSCVIVERDAEYYDIMTERVFLKRTLAGGGVEVRFD